uniref:protein-arginine deiminase n=1 Tax=Sphenodon punctatus TaxID=8508 RepID=A0A8D0GR52_SPHPU
IFATEILVEAVSIKKPVGTPRWPLHAGVEVVVTMDTPSISVNDSKVSFYLGNEYSLFDNISGVSLDADTSRSREVNRNGTNKSKWTWGPDGQGAVLLVNCDRDGPGSGMDDTDRHVQSSADLQDMSPMILRTQGPSDIFANYKLVLHVSMFDADKVRVFHLHNGNESLSQYKHVLGSNKLSYTVERGEDIFYVEGLAFPDAGFSGLVSFHATLLEVSHKDLPDTPVFKETVVFHVAPWIMTPNTLKPLEVFVCSIEMDSESPNADFLETVRSFVEKTKCKLTICPEVENRGDRWIQDEMELGYVEAPHRSFPVVFDSPRNRGLRDFPFKRVLGPNFGYVTRELPNGQVTSLDSFGNLDVSPPVTVGGKEYPLGRILIGSSLPRFGGRKMTKIVTDFLYAQKVQAPVELYSDWLNVGHVDEFLSFVPAPDRKGFRLLLANPSACYKLFKEKQKEGHGDAALFKGLKREEITIEAILADKMLHHENFYVQNCIDWNRSILKQKLGLTEGDIIDIPQLFKLEGSWAAAFFPNMVNMLVLGKDLGIPKPFGPITDGQCCLEAKVCSLLEPLGLTCTFINDFFSYHVLSGEVHCGTNVRRQPFSFKWWNMIP